MAPIKAKTKRRMESQAELDAIMEIIERNHLKRKATSTAELKKLCRSEIKDSHRGWVAYRLTILLRQGLIERTVFGYYKKVEL